MGASVLPPFLSVVFDPTRRKLGAIDLNGWYEYDDEGVPAQPVKAVESGVLRTFLLSRSPVKGFDRSNGHGRRQAGLEAVSRQSNLLVELSAPRFVADQRAHLAAMPAGIRQAVARAEAAGDCDTPAYQAAMTAFYRKHVCRLDPWPQCLLRSFEKTGQTVYVHMWGPSEFTATGTLRETDLTGELGRIALPTLLTCGRFDEATPETTAFYQSLLPGSQRHVFEDASHLHHLEKPEAYRRIVGDFLRRVEGAPEDENGQRSPGAGSREGEPAAGAPKG